MKNSLVNVVNKWGDNYLWIAIVFKVAAFSSYLRTIEDLEVSRLERKMHVQYFENLSFKNYLV